MSGSDPIRSLLEEIATLGRRRGIPVDRLCQEVDDHLSQAAENLRRRGWPSAQAERMAVERFGTAVDLVAAVARVEGGAMRGIGRKIGGTLGMASAVALALAHILPSQSIPGTPWALVVLAAGMALAASLVLLVWAAGLSGLASMWSERPGWIALWGLAVISLTVLVGGTGLLERTPGDLLARSYFAGVGAVALLIQAVSWKMGRRFAGGLGLSLAGVGGLVLNLWSGQDAAGIGSGSANLTVAVLCMGFLTMVAAGVGADTVRSILGAGRRRHSIDRPVVGRL